MILRLLYLASFFILIACSIVFGYTRFYMQRLEGEAWLNYAANKLINIPFDAEFHNKNFVAYKTLKNNKQALENLKSAIYYRPDDYRLWMESGKIQQNENQIYEAENSFRRSIQLAPLYSKPHFYYGKFLVKNYSTDKGFSELRIASQSNPQYFYKAAEIAWEKANGDGSKMIEFLSAQTSSEIEKLNAFFLAKEQFDSIVYLNCSRNVTKSSRDDIIRKLLKKRDFYSARQVYNCRDSSEQFYTFENGDFETVQLKEENDFGWCIKSLPDQVEAAFDQNTASSGKSSLKFTFNGNFKLDLPLLSQIIVVEKNQKYLFRYSYKTSELLTAGMPVLQLILKNSHSDELIKEIKLPPENTMWITRTIEVKTNAESTALEVILTRTSCNERICPIFGHLWLDNFFLQKKN